MPRAKPLIGLNADESLIDRIDDFRFEYRFPSRAAAIKWLLEWALDQNPEPQALHARKSAESAQRRVGRSNDDQVA